jgi:hypothetical protein
MAIRKMELCFRAFIVVAAFCIMAPIAQAGETYVITKGDAKWLTLERTADGWKASSSGRVIQFVKDDKGYAIKKASSATKLQFKGEKAIVEGKDGKPLFRVKTTDEKIKIYRGADENELWAVKKKEDKDAYKVKAGDEKIGKVKFYPEKSVVKAKNAQDVELCRMRSNELSAAPAVCLFGGLGEEEQVILFAVLMLNPGK